MFKKQEQFYGKICSDNSLIRYWIFQCRTEMIINNLSWKGIPYYVWHSYIVRVMNEQCKWRLTTSYHAVCLWILSVLFMLQCT